MASQHLPLGGPDRAANATWLAPLSVVLGSSVTLLPMVATFPLLPPFGLLLLMGWRLHRGDALPVWAPVALGLLDDLVSGQPLGSAMLLWTICYLAMDVLDTRLVWRDFWHDWLIATGAVGFVLIAGRLVASPIEAHVDTALLLQFIASALLYPPVARLVARLDRARRPR